MDKAIALMRQAAAQGAQLITFPEAFLSGYPIWLRAPKVAANDDLLAIGYAAYLESAITVGGPELSEIAAEARALGVFVTIGVGEKTASGGSVYAALVFVDPDKGVVNVHRKLKPTFHERLIWSDGDGHGLQAIEWRGVRFGGLNCYENWQPLARQALYAQGEQVHIAAWPGDLNVTEHISQFIAMEGRIYVVSVSGLLRVSDIPVGFPLRKYVVDGRDIINDGGSTIVAPGGKVIAGPVVGVEDILYCEIDLKLVSSAHMKLDPAGHYGRADVLQLAVNRRRSE